MGWGWLCAVIGGGMIWGGVALRDDAHSDLGGWLIALGWFTTALLAYGAGEMRETHRRAPVCGLCREKVINSSVNDQRFGRIHSVCRRKESDRLTSLGLDPEQTMGPEDWRAE